MSERNPSADPPPSHQHEGRDADFHKLAWVGIGILLLIVFGFVVTEIVFYAFVGRHKITPPTALFTAAQMPPPPRLQQRSGVDLRTYLRQQNHILDTYGWVNRPESVVRIPIKRAMALLLQQGLPTRKPGQMTLGVSAPHTLPRGDFSPPPKPVPGPRKQ